MLIHRIKLKNILSFGPDGMELELKPLNVLIGPNGSGKSNLIEAIGLLRAVPRDITAPILAGGGVGNWIWNRDRTTPYSTEPVSAEVEAVLGYPPTPGGPRALRHGLAFGNKGQRFELIDERIEDAGVNDSIDRPQIYFELRGGKPNLNSQNTTLRPLLIFDNQKSVLAQIRDPNHYPELTWLSDVYPQVRLYREWSFGRNTPLRLPQDAALPNDFLIEGGQNLGLMLNRLKREPVAKSRFLDSIRQLYEGIVDFDVIIEGGTVQVILQEGNKIVPATRLSDGTLRYLCLLAILCHPNPPPLVCLEEPELGLHPDILPGLADLLREASERCQLIVTTHSDTLVDALTDTSESVVVCEKENGQTTLRRLEKDRLAGWLEDYRLGEYWASGGIGGNRW